MPTRRTGPRRLLHKIYKHPAACQVWSCGLVGHAMVGSSVRMADSGESLGLARSAFWRQPKSHRAFKTSLGIIWQDRRKSATIRWEQQCHEGVGRKVCGLLAGVFFPAKILLKKPPSSSSLFMRED